MDGLGEQFRYVATGVVHHLALLDGFAAVESVALQERGPRAVYFDFEGDAKFAAVAEDGLMLGRQARGARVEIVTFGEAAGFRGAVGHFDAGAGADGPVAPPGAIARFEDRTTVSGFLQLPGRDHPGDARAKNDDTLALAGIFRQADRAGLGGRSGEQAERLHKHISGAEAAGLPDLR